MSSGDYTDVMTLTENETSSATKCSQPLWLQLYPAGRDGTSSGCLLCPKEFGEERHMLSTPSLNTSHPPASATVWPLKQTSSCETIQFQVIKRINLVMLQSEREHVIHYSSITGLIRTRLIRVHHCLKLSTKKMF